MEVEPTPGHGAMATRGGGAGGIGKEVSTGGVFVINSTGVGNLGAGVGNIGTGVGNLGDGTGVCNLVWHAQPSTENSGGSGDPNMHDL
jgi:hypothetical protein